GRKNLRVPRPLRAALPDRRQASALLLRVERRGPEDPAQIVQTLLSPKTVHAYNDLYEPESPLGLRPRFVSGGADSRPRRGYRRNRGPDSEPRGDPVGRGA